MQRLHDNAIAKIDYHVHLNSKWVLEIGCGNGSKTLLLAEKCQAVSAIDPDESAIATAQQKFAAPNIAYQVGNAQNLEFDDSTFDVVLFSLSYHHVPISKMDSAIREAVRVAKRNACIVFIEPTFTGTFFETELQFWASDADERKEKAAAYHHMLDSNLLQEVAEIFDDVMFKFDSAEDFIEAMEPKRNLRHIEQFLKDHDFQTKAQRRINVFRKKL